MDAQEGIVQLRNSHYAQIYGNAHAAAALSCTIRPKSFSQQGPAHCIRRLGRQGNLHFIHEIIRAGHRVFKVRDGVARGYEQGRDLAASLQLDAPWRRVL